MTDTWSFPVLQHILEFEPFPKQPIVFMRLQCKSLGNTVRKVDIARSEHFLLFL